LPGVSFSDVRGWLPEALPPHKRRAAFKFGYNGLYIVARFSQPKIFNNFFQKISPSILVAGKEAYAALWT